MKLPDSYYAFVQDILSVNDKQLALERLDAICQKGFRINTVFETEIYNTFSYNQAQNLLECLRDLHFNIADSRDGAKGIAVITAAVQSLPEVTLHTAIPLRREFLLLFLEQIFYFLNQKVVLKLLVEPGIVAGAVFEYEGKYWDGSFKKKWNHNA